MEVAFMTASELGHTVGVSEATVIRFASYLSYQGYPEFQREFQRMVSDELTTVRRLRDAQETPATASALHPIRDQELQNIRATFENVPSRDIQEVARAVLRASVVFVIGLRASACLAHFFAYQARQIAPDIKLITSGGADGQGLIHRAEKGLVIAFAFPRYPRETVELVDAARGEGLHVVAITDSFKSPLAERAHKMILAPVTSPSFVDLLAAPMAISAAIVNEASNLDHERALKGLAQFERVAKRTDLFWTNGGRRTRAAES
jgi:DNA-binding MurR/RpiR family transcriptional regulator